MTKKELYKRIDEIEERIKNFQETIDELHEKIDELEDEQSRLVRELNGYDEEAEDDRLDRWEEERRASRYDKK